MNLESTVKYHFAKSTQTSDSPRATASDSLTGTDIMAAMGMTQERAAMGNSAFLGKMGISRNGREKAINQLAQYAMTCCNKVAALRRLESDIKPLVMQQLATFAYEDCSRSAASNRPCDCCKGAGFIEADAFTMKTHTPAKEKEFVKMSSRMGMDSIKPSIYEARRQVRESVDNTSNPNGFSRYIMYRQSGSPALAITKAYGDNVITPQSAVIQKAPGGTSTSAALSFTDGIPSTADGETGRILLTFPTRAAAYYTIMAYSASRAQSQGAFFS